MSKKTHTNPLSKREVEKLRINPCVASVSANTVRFTEKFKKLAYDGKTKGIPVAETMRRNGIDPEVLGPSRVEGFSYTLNKMAKRETGFADGRKENYRRPPRTGNETVEQRVRQLENELAYTRQEVEFKKAAGGQYGGSEAMGIQAPAEVKYRLIHEAVHQDDNVLNIGSLCEIAGVSRSGYYAWLEAAPVRRRREESDSTDFAPIKQAYEGTSE